eukprot:UN27485
MQQIIHACFMGGVMDLVAIILLLLIIATLYRLPALIAEMYEKQAFLIFRFTSKKIIMKHCTGIMNDFLQVGELFLNSLLLLITLVNFLQYGILGVQAEDFHQLLKLSRRLRNNIFRDLRDWFLLLTVWQTYKFL